MKKQIKWKLYFWGGTYRCYCACKSMLEHIPREFFEMNCMIRDVNLRWALEMHSSRSRSPLIRDQVSRISMTKHDQNPKFKTLYKTINICFNIPSQKRSKNLHNLNICGTFHIGISLCIPNPKPIRFIFSSARL